VLRLNGWVNLLAGILISVRACYVMTIHEDYWRRECKPLLAPETSSQKCLKLLDDVARTRESLIITKHGKAVAKLIPMPPPSELFGALAGSVWQEGDIVSPSTTVQRVT
jgi:antitoxin (DNA-binding transcriptional repressor) of toxin-antitoxin stability system